MTLNILLTTSRVLTLDLENSQNDNNYLPSCSLKWRRKILWVTKIADNSMYLIPALKRQQWLKDCLRNSWVRQVCLDSRLGEEGIRIWADVCHASKKKVSLRIASCSQEFDRSQRIYWSIKRAMDWAISVLLLLLLSPIMLAIALSIKVFSPGPVLFRQWRVGRRGQLFQVYKFRTTIAGAETMYPPMMRKHNGFHPLESDPRITSIGKWLRKFNLDELPQLLNVLKGEMSLVGPRPWSLCDALGSEAKSKTRLNALPGITGTWQVQKRSNLADLEQITRYDLDYLSSWSLSKDLNILLLTIPKLIFGFGAY